MKPKSPPHPPADKAVRAPARRPDSLVRSSSPPREEHLRQVIAGKRQWHYRPTEEQKAAGFKGWYSHGFIPHFDAPGAWQFITYRLADSVPANLRREWEAIRQLEDEREKFRRMERHLDAGYGGCALRDPRIAQLVQDNLWFHDGRSYRLLAWVIMPNHVHLLAELRQPLGVVLKNWKSYTASDANKLLGAVGQTFWQADYFDRYIRDRDHCRRTVRYIENNPVKPGLARVPDEWLWSSARYRGPYASDQLPRIPTSRGADHPARGPAGEPLGPVPRLTHPADTAVRPPQETGQPCPVKPGASTTPSLEEPRGQGSPRS